MSVAVKVCGITREIDADFALQCGASRLGFILYEKSSRSIEFQASLCILSDAIFSTFSASSLGCLFWMPFFLIFS